MRGRFGAPRSAVRRPWEARDLTQNARTERRVHNDATDGHSRGSYRRIGRGQTSSSRGASAAAAPSGVHGIWADPEWSFSSVSGELARRSVRLPGRCSAGAEQSSRPASAPVPPGSRPSVTQPGRGLPLTGESNGPCWRHYTIAPVHSRMAPRRACDGTETPSACRPGEFWHSPIDNHV